ncbi:MAG: hypothetical protein IT464_15930 [Planctomycetes bacterium]|nr:hypothetical protein [Planctomycetota bacterium]
MEDNKEDCPTCSPGGLKFSKHNGRGRVEVPEDFMADKLGSIDAQIAEAMTAAEMLGASAPSREPASRLPSSSSYEAGAPGKAERPAKGFGADPFSWSQHTAQPAPPAESRRPSSNQFTLAETEHASLLGIGPPTGPPTTTQFTLAESGAADVFPALMQQEGGDNKDEPLPDPFPGVRTADGAHPYPDASNNEKWKGKGGTATGVVDAEAASPKKGPSEVSDFSAASPAKCNKTYVLSWFGQTRLHYFENCDTTVSTSLKGSRKQKKNWWDADSDVWDGKGLTEEQMKELADLKARAEEDCPVPREKEMLDRLSKTIENGGDLDTPHKKHIDVQVALVANEVVCEPDCPTKRVNLIYWHAGRQTSSGIVNSAPTRLGNPRAKTVVTVNAEGNLVITVRFELWVQINWTVYFTVTCTK